MQSVVIILLSLGFTTGVILSSLNNKAIADAKLETDIEQQDELNVDSGIDVINDSGRDSIFPIL